MLRVYGKLSDSIFAPDTIRPDGVCGGGFGAAVVG